MRPDPRNELDPIREADLRELYRVRESVAVAQMNERQAQTAADADARQAAADRVVSDALAGARITRIVRQQAEATPTQGEEAMTDQPTPAPSGATDLDLLADAIVAAQHRAASKQFGRADVAAMTPDEVASAFASGRLRDLLGGGN